MGLALAAGFAACGLDENGIVSDASTFDATAFDVGSDTAVGSDAGDASEVAVDNWQPPACVDLDASCIGNIPDGWSPIGAWVDAATGCPGDASDFELRDWVTNPKLVAGSCTCGAGAPSSATWSCAGSVTVHGGVDNACTNSGSDTFDAAVHCSAITVTATGGGTQQAAATAPTAVPPSGCTSNPSAFAVTDTAVRTCRPLQCATDYCGLKTAGYSLCIAFNGPAACPGGFNPLGTPAGEIDTASDIQGSCKTCTSALVTNNVACTASFAAYSVAGCDDAGLIGTFPADGKCKNVGVDIHSIEYVPGAPPAATCTNPTGGGANGPSFGAPLTVCCKP